ncbi:imidazolonepropionase [Celerinatantimonas sp. YJH-8]|uniref:imidazolonepropionase n=1 Tax=Celerinatantimonas sp. YJH-8 TaxID=3228714 RepID=UPI0038C0A604
MDWVLTNVHLVTMETGAIGYQVQGPVSILIQSDQIAAIGPSGLFAERERLWVDGNGALVTPGLIDCHTHLVFAGNRAQEFEMRLQGVPYTEIAKRGGGILATVNATREASLSDLVTLALPRLDGLIRSGVTTVEIKSGYGLNLGDELKCLEAANILASQRRIHIEPTLLAAHAVPPEYQHKADDYVDFICDTIIPEVARRKLATAVDVFCESIAFNLAQTEKVFRSAIDHGLAIKGHTEQLSNMGGSALTARMGGLSVDHLEHLDVAGVQALAKSGTVATLLPGAFYFLRETQFPPVEALRQYGVPMALSTDANPGTSPFYDLSLIMNMGCTLFKLTPEEALRGVTCHAAKALGLGAVIGQIAPGMRADLTLWDTRHPADISYQVGQNKVMARVIAGQYESVWDY